MSLWDNFVNPFTHGGVFYIEGGDKAYKQQTKRNNEQKAKFEKDYGVAASPLNLFLASAGVLKPLGKDSPESQHAEVEQQIAQQSHEANAAVLTAQENIVTEQQNIAKADYDQAIATLSKQEVDAQRQWNEYIQGGIVSAYAGGLRGTSGLGGTTSASVNAWEQEMRNRAQEAKNYIEGQKNTAFTKYQAGKNITGYKKDILDEKQTLNGLSFASEMENINWWLYNNNPNKDASQQWANIGSRIGMSLLGAGITSGNPILILGGLGLTGFSVASSYTSGSSYTPYVLQED